MGRVVLDPGGRVSSLKTISVVSKVGSGVKGARIIFRPFLLVKRVGPGGVRGIGPLSRRGFQKRVWRALLL
jgi:hypothetical protein